ncbi:MAG: holo-ACP synthase [Chlamydiales bacterium]|nr:holo-ACP synthase [Chlamydiales bacterium]
MIKGLGSDIIAVERITKALERHGDRFLDTVFTEREVAYCRRYQEADRHFAGRFAAKEAVVKSLGTGFRQGITFVDIEVINDGYGKPEIHLSKKAAETIGPGRFLITISHCHSYATATAIWVDE